MIESFSDVVYFARMPDLLLDQGSKKSSSLSFVLDPPLGKDDCKKIRMMMCITINGGHLDFQMYRGGGRRGL